MRKKRTMTAGLIVLLLAIAAILFVRQQAVAAPVVGSQAPDFALTDQNGQVRHLSDYRGHYVALYFYPKDETPHCTQEACSFRDNFARLTSMGVKVLGVSVQSPDSHKAFAAHHELPFTLLSDPDGKVSATYGSLYNFIVFRLSKRHTFLIDPQGRVDRVWLNVDPARQVDQIVEALGPHH